MRRAIGAALALAFLLAHAPAQPAPLDDVDAVNAALALRDFDVTRHQPDPPGAPLYIVLGKVALAATARLEPLVSRPAGEGRALALVSLACGACAIPLAYALFAALAGAGRDADARRRAAVDVRAVAATLVMAACPLYWYLSARPLCDMAGLAAALAAQVCLVVAWCRQRPSEDGDTRLGPAMMAASGRMIVLGGLLSGLAIGTSWQTVWLTAPLMAGVLIDRIGRGVAGALLGAGLTFGAGVLAWAVPLVVASGGIRAYAVALAAQAEAGIGSGAALYLHPSPRLLVEAVRQTLLSPWDSVLLGAGVMVLAALGVAALAVRDRRALLVVGLVGAPYLAFHLFVQDTTLVRSALPLVPVVAFLAMRGAALAGRPAALAAAAILAAWSLGIAVPALAAHVQEPSPAARALDAMRETIAASGAPGALAVHETVRRSFEAEEWPVSRVLPSPQGREWLELGRYWREGGTAPLWMLADPRRTDLALIDPASRRDSDTFAWSPAGPSAFGGMRPSRITWYRLAAPGWFAGEGWSLTPETAGVSRLMGRGPHLGPLTAWVRPRQEAARVLVGGRNLGAAGAPATRFTVAANDAPLAAWDVAPGFFLRVFDVPAGALAAGPDGWARLTIAATPADTGGPAAAVEQFDLQSAGSVMWGFADGWHEAELDPIAGPWRWTSARATLLVDGATTPLTLRMRVESPRRHFDGPAHVRVAAGDRTLASWTVDTDTELDVEIPLDALAGAAGRLVVETDRTFVPADRDGGADRRQLGLRVLSVDIVPARAALR